VEDALFYRVISPCQRRTGIGRISHVAAPDKRFDERRIFGILAASMGWLHELRAFLKTAYGQLTNSSHVRPTSSVDTREPYFTKNFHSVAKERGLTEADARDVYSHGSVIKQNMMVRKYNGYEIGIYHFVDGQSGKTIITSIWKREKR